MDSVLSARQLNFQGLIDYPPIDIERKSTTFLCGESGCGKSTLLKLFNATVSPARGEVTYNGQPVESLNTVLLRREVMLVSQNVFLFDESVEENFRQFYFYRNMKAPSSDQIRQALAVCRAGFELSSRCQTMSGGERQRVFTAIYLSFMPRVLMLDEPTSALDEQTADHFFVSIKDFCTHSGITLIAVSHDSAMANKFADEKIVLKKVNP